MSAAIHAQEVKTEQSTEPSAEKSTEPSIKPSNQGSFTTTLFTVPVWKAHLEQTNGHIFRVYNRVEDLTLAVDDADLDKRVTAAGIAHIWGLVSGLTTRGFDERCQPFKLFYGSQPAGTPYEGELTLSQCQNYCLVANW